MRPPVPPHPAHWLVLLILCCGGCSPSGSGPTVSALFVTPQAGGFLVTWQLSAPAFARVDVWEAAQPLQRLEGTPRAIPAPDYRVPVTGLKADTLYVYQIVAGPTRALGDDAVRTPPATARTPPEIRITNVSIKPETTEAAVTWTTSRPTDSSVAYGRSEEVEARRSNPLQTGVLAHAVKLTGLEPGQVYQLKVVATDSGSRAPVVASAPVSFTTRARAGGEIQQIMPRQRPGRNTLVDLSRDYLLRLKSLSAADRNRLERQIRDSAPEERIELTPEEKAELTGRATDPADGAQFERRVDLLQRWIIHLGQQGKDIEPLCHAAVTLSNRFLVTPPRAAEELDRTVKALAGME